MKKLIKKFLLKVGKNPDYESSVLWFLDESEDVNDLPWKRHQGALYLDFPVRIPEKLEGPEKEVVLPWTILGYVRHLYDLQEDSIPGTYRLKLNDFGDFHKVDHPNVFVEFMFAVLLKLYYEAFKENTTDKLEDELASKVAAWNNHPYVQQERIMSFIGRHLEKTALKEGISEREALQAINNYFYRTDLRTLTNLETFKRKIKEILGSSEGLGNQARFLLHFLNELDNGGVNLHTIEDLIPFYNNIKFN